MNIMLLLLCTCPVYAVVDGVNFFDEYYVGLGRRIGPAYVVVNGVIFIDEYLAYYIFFRIIIYGSWW